MNNCIPKQEFMSLLFDDPCSANRAAEIGEAILAAPSLMPTDVSVEMVGESAARYICIQRFLKANDPRSALWR